MAKTTGPLFSMTASGKYAGALVFSRWKGRPTVRQLVTPANPKSTGQQDSRNRVRTAGAGQHWASVSLMIESGQTTTDRARLIAAAPAGQSWNANLVDATIGAGALNYTAATDAYAALTQPQRDAWTAAAAALTPAIPQVAQQSAGGGTAPALTAGAVYFYYRSALGVLGLSPAPTGVPPTYA